MPSSITVQSGLATCSPIAAAEGGSALAIEVGFQAVADGFVQQDARPARPEHHGHFARRRLDGIQLDDRLAAGFLGERLGRMFFVEEVERDAAAAAGITVLRSARAFARQHRDAHTSHGLAVETEAAVAGRDQHVAQAIGVTRLHLEHARIVGSGGQVGALHQFDTLGQTGFIGRLEHRDTGCGAWLPETRS